MGARLVAARLSAVVESCSLGSWTAPCTQTLAHVLLLFRGRRSFLQGQERRRKSVCRVVN